MTYTTGYGHSGIMFNVVAQKDIVITSLTFEWNGGYGDPHPFEVWKMKEYGSYNSDYTPGAWGDYSNPDNWELVKSGTATSTWTGWSSAPGSTGELDIEVPEGETQAILIHGVSRGILSYWPNNGAGAAGDVFTGDNSIQITNGQPTPFKMGSSLD